MPEPAAIGIDVGGTKLVAATVDRDGHVHERRRLETAAHDAARLVDDLRGLVAELDADLPVGVGFAGLVTPAGMVTYGPNVGVRDLPVGDLLSDTSSGPVVVVNDGSAAVLGEQRVGAARGRRDVVMITLGTGVGGGIVAGGELLLGGHGFAGELGHVIVEDGGRDCPCGNRGCLEAYASGTSIGRVARERLTDPAVASSLRNEPVVDGRAVSTAAADGDALARDVLVTAGTWLGVATASVVNAFDPEVVLIGGGAAPSTAPWVLPAARAALEQRLMGAPSRTAPALELAALGDDAGMVGAALLAAERADRRGPAASRATT